jgi:hypothetical protein
MYRYQLVRFSSSFVLPLAPYLLYCCRNYGTAASPSLWNQSLLNTMVKQELEFNPFSTAHLLSISQLLSREKE